ESEDLTSEQLEAMITEDVDTPFEEEFETSMFDDRDETSLMEEMSESEEVIADEPVITTNVEELKAEEAVNVSPEEELAASVMDEPVVSDEEVVEEETIGVSAETTAEEEPVLTSDEAAEITEDVSDQSASGDEDLQAATEDEMSSEDELESSAEVEEIKIEDQLFETNKQLAEEKLNEGRFEEAMEYYLLAQQIKPDDLYVQAKLGYTYLKLSRFNEAISTLRAVVDRDMTNVWAYMDLGVTYNRQGLTREAVTYLEKGVLNLLKRRDEFTDHEYYEITEIYAYIVSHSVLRKMTPQFRKLLDANGFKEERKGLVRLIKDQSKYE
ncbi:MAG: tetratricopeptide repeat protein, partial [bacterium]